LQCGFMKLPRYIKKPSPEQKIEPEINHTNHSNLEKPRKLKRRMLESQKKDLDEILNRTLDERNFMLHINKTFSEGVKGEVVKTL